MKRLWLVILFIAISKPAWAYDGPKMTNQALSYTPAVDDKTCTLATFSEFDKFKFSKKGNVRKGVHSGCAVSFTEDEFYSTFQSCSLQPNNRANIHADQLCQIWTEGKEVHFYIPTKEQSMCLFVCITQE